MLPTHTRSTRHTPFNLEAVMRQYASQPDLLELILSSKVEEDRRRTEEAKLKRKEIDYALHLHQQKEDNFKPKDHQLAPVSSPTCSPLSSPSLSTTSSLSSPPSPPATLQPDLSSWAYHLPLRQSTEWISSITLPPLTAELPPITKRPSTDSMAVHKRRKREMHAITAVVETKEFPYNDNYLWRNNGNTIHKKSGNRSIYYKCANHQQGCPVNKTCTFTQDTGDYLIKYRGTHLLDCSTIKRIHQV